MTISEKREQLAQAHGMPAIISLKMLTELGEEPYPVLCPECGQIQFSGPHAIAVCGNCGDQFATGLAEDNDAG